MIPREYQGLFSNIARYVTLSQEEQEQIAAIINITPIKKRQFIDQPGYISPYRNYIVKGAFRSFFLDKDGKEHTVQIAIEDWFVSDFYSYITRTPATLFVEALEDSTLLQMKYEDIEPLCGKIHSLSEYFRVSTEKAFAYSRNRALSNLSMTAEERYLKLTSMYPGIVNRVPQRIIASYLGMTPEFLSKIRKGIAQNS
ncbi:Crp/Fnr family transcriptional regulator [Flagellimonas meridianipacifica]|uniref:CRP-like cAMP-binding protein n=1 Tax=Flagellimonas meridianipacifica TaxID=1080225 RepID=A0A2T0MG56_9FLAO|nr:Crp/Fnr family transcriptional regulator [Allomuricauda pacifica]PRX56545.1 CRP-like cAMP-binding protein [Allomuricauda pacifica]